MKNEQIRLPSILLIEDDDEVRVGIARMLETSGYRVVSAANELESASAITDAGSDIGLILVSQRAASDDALAAGRRIRKDAGIGDLVPVVVIPSEFVKEMEGQDENVGGSDHKTYMTSQEQLEELLNRLLIG